MRMQIEITSESIGSHLANDFYEFQTAIRTVANWHQSGAFEDYKSSDQYVRIGKEFGKWLAENEYNFNSGNVVLIDFFTEIVNSYKNEMKNA